MRTPAIALACAAALSGLQAYVLLSPARTWNSAPTYVVDNRGLSSITDADHGVSKTVNAILSSTSWGSAGSGFQIQVVSGSVSSFSVGDGTPMLNFTDPLAACTGSCIAATFTTSYSLRGGTSYKITDADIVTNSTGKSFTSQGEDPNGVGCSNELYIEGVMVHETGHGLGLAHSSVSGATMFPSASFCNNSQATIENDDRDGIVALYGEAPFLPCQTFTNWMPGGGGNVYLPQFFALAGTQSGYLAGPAGTDFNLWLWKWNGSSWTAVASGVTPSSTEYVIYNGGSGTYLWSVYSYQGSGQFHFYQQHP